MSLESRIESRIESYDELQQKLCDIETRIAEYEINSFMACKKTIHALEKKILDLETRLELERGGRETEESKLTVTESMLETMIQKREEERNSKVKLRLMLEKLEAQADMFDVHMQKVRAEAAINNIQFTSEMAEARANDAKIQMLQQVVTEGTDKIDNQQNQEPQ